VESETKPSAIVSKVNSFTGKVPPLAAVVGLVAAASLRKAEIAPPVVGLALHLDDQHLHGFDLSVTAEADDVLDLLAPYPQVPQSIVVERPEMADCTTCPELGGKRTSRADEMAI
jgi:hypothetical protein